MSTAGSRPGSGAVCSPEQGADVLSGLREIDFRNTVEAGCGEEHFLLEVPMLSLRRFSIALIAGAVLALALPVHAADVDKFLPEDTEIVVVVNAKQLLDSPIFKKHFIAQIREQIESNDEITEILDDLDFDPFKDLTSITAALTMIGSDAKGLIIAHGKFDKAKFEEKAEEVAKDRPNVITINKEGDRSIYEVNVDGGGKPLFVGIVDETTIVAGPEKQYVLDAFAKGEGKNQGAVKMEVRDLIEKVDTRQSVWFAATANAFLKGDLSRDDKSRKSLEKMSGITAGFTVDRGIKAAFAIAANSADNAKELAEEIKMGLNQAKGLLALLAEQNKEFAPFIDAVSSLRVNTEGSTITLKAEISEDVVEKSLKKN
jgi:hypothetical protein